MRARFKPPVFDPASGVTGTGLQGAPMPLCSPLTFARWPCPAPCGECHLSAGEVCDICGRRQPFSHEPAHLPINMGLMTCAVLVAVIVLLITYLGHVPNVASLPDGTPGRSASQAESLDSSGVTQGTRPSR